MAKPLIVGNWKSYITSINDAEKLFKGIEKALPRILKSEVVVCAPYPFIEFLEDSYSGKRISFGAQNVYFESGAHTGEVSAAALKSIGVSSVIVGHAERRSMGETDEDVSKKIGALLDQKMRPIVCVGEKERDKDGHYLHELETSIISSLAILGPNDLKKIVIAYEPVWAIGSPLPPSARAIRETIIFIRKVLADRFDKTQALKAKIIYGGAVDAHNVEELSKESGANGFLLGRASVDAESFTNIISTFQ